MKGDRKARARLWPRRQRARTEELRDIDYASEPDSLTAGNLVVPLVDGEETFTSMLDEISAATSYVHLETYILADDTIGTTFSRVLRERARAGVKVRVMFDSFGSLTLPSGYIGELEDAGVEVHEFHRLVPWKISRWTQRDHRKILVVDGHVAFTGGLNIGDDYAPAELGGRNWRDTHVRVRGPLVGQLDALFVMTWRRQTKRTLDGYQPPRPMKPEGEQMRAMAIANRFLGRRTAIRRAYLHAIRTARDAIYIANAYFMPDPGIRRALIRAAKRGVSVHVMTNERSDMRSVQYAGESLYARLLKGGVKIHLFHTRMMHSKIAVIDGIWATVGSYNLDYISLLTNLEVIVEVIDTRFGERMVEIYEQDMTECRELVLEQWKQRPWWRKLAARFFYKFRRWL